MFSLKYRYKQVCASSRFTTLWLSPNLFSSLYATLTACSDTFLPAITDILFSQNLIVCLIEYLQSTKSAFIYDSPLLHSHNMQQYVRHESISSSSLLHCNTGRSRSSMSKWASQTHDIRTFPFLLVFHKFLVFSWVSIIWDNLHQDLDRRINTVGEKADQLP